MSFVGRFVRKGLRAAQNTSIAGTEAQTQLDLLSDRPKAKSRKPDEAGPGSATGCKSRLLGRYRPGHFGLI